MFSMQRCFAVSLLLAGLLRAGTLPGWAGEKQAAQQLPAGASARLGRPPVQHNGPITTLAFSVDGKSLLAGSLDAAFSFWDVSTGKELRRLDYLPYGFLGALSPDRQRLAISRRTLPSDVNDLSLVDLNTGGVLRNFRHQVFGSYSAFSADGKLLASAGQPMQQGPRTWEKSIRVWNVDSGTEIFAVEDGWAYEPAFSPDGNKLLTCSSNGTALWDLATGKRLEHWKNRAVAVAFAPGGNKAAFRCDDAVEIFDVVAGGKLNRFMDRMEWSGSQAGIAFFPDGKSLATCSGTNEVCIWDLATGKERRRLPAASLARCLAVSPDGKLLAAGCECGRIFLWDAATGKEHVHVRPHKQVVAATFSRTGKPLAVAMDARDLVVSDVLTAEELHRVPFWDVDGIWQIMPTPAKKGKVGTCSAAALSPDGERLAVTDEIVNLRMNELTERKAVRRFRLFNVRTGKEFLSETQEVELTGLWILGWGRIRQSFSFSPDGKVLAQADFDGKIRLLDPATGKEIGAFPGGAEEKGMTCGSPTWTADGKRLVLMASSSAGFNAAAGVRIWDQETGKVARPFKAGADRANALAISSDGRLLAASTGFLWTGDLSTGKPLDNGPWVHGGNLPAVIAFAPQGSLLASAGSNGEIWLWDVASNRSRRLSGHKAAVRTLVFAPDGKSLLSGSDDGTAILWNMDAR